MFVPVWHTRPSPPLLLMAAARGADLADLRCKLAASVGFAARRLWRQPLLEPQDEVVLDLLCEALARLGLSLKPKARRAVAASFAAAPTHVQRLVSKLEAIGGRPVPATAAAGLHVVGPSELASRRGS